MIAKSCRWELTAVAVAALLTFTGSNALALSLGRITVQSALGEPLRAEIDISDIDAEEAAALKVQLASPTNFKSAGLDYSPVLTGLRMVLQKRPDGRSYLRLSSDRVVQEPFVDLILDAAWQNGRLMRNYTMLFDPPGMRPAPVVQAPPAPLPTSRSAPAAPAAAAEPRVLQAPRLAAPAIPPLTRQGSAGAEVKAVPPPAGSAGQRTVKVRPGESASKIAMSHKLVDVSLDQMLVAMQRGNPNAFIEGNINRIKAGAIVALPTEQQATAVSTVQASQIITAQSQDFNRYRQLLAGNPGATQLTPAERMVSGTIEAKVEDKKSAAQTPDKLTLSKGTVQNATDLEQLALARNAEDVAKRAAQVNQNTAELNQLAQSAAAMAAAGVASGAGAGSATSSAVSPASAPGVTKPVTPTLPAAPQTSPVSGFLDELMSNPMLPALGSALALLLAGLGFYKFRQRQKKAEADSSFMESSFHAESFFGDSGGQKVDTDEALGTSSVMAYASSRLDTAEETDPLAEADVYLAYGRDLQAEEVLKDALLAQPERVVIHQKLLDIYAKRQDAKSYAAMATLAYPLLKNNEPQWAQVCVAGLALEPGNALYLAGSQPVAATASTFPSLPVVPLMAATGDEMTRSAESMDAPADNAVNLDFDLDFSLEEPKPITAENPDTSTLPVIGESALPGLEAASSSPAPATAALPTSSAPLDMLEFDFDTLSLDLDDSDSDGAPTKQPSQVHTDALESKLALAEEFKVNGDHQVARELIQQVIEEADGPLQIKAQQALSQL